MRLSSLAGRLMELRLAAVIMLGMAATVPMTAAAQAPRATIHRDAWGVPHVFADTDAGVMFGMAWALAEDDWPLIEGNYLQALGRSAELNGEDALASDWMARALRIVPLSIAEYNAGTPRLRGLLDAYAEGMNRWLAQRPASEARVLTRVEPWYPLALIRFKYYQNEFLGYAGLRGAWIAPMVERSAAGVSGPALPVGDGAVRDGVAFMQRGEPHMFTLESHFDGWGHRPRGSNQWALAPSRTSDGSTMLLINPHQSFVGVQRYAEIHIDSREGLRFSGLTVFGFLLPYMGNNERLGWAYTDNYADHSDLFALTFDDADPLRYRYSGGHRTAATWTDSVHVLTAAGMQTRNFRFWNTHHGPIVGVGEDGRPLAVRLARMNEGGWYDQWDAMIRARSLDEWKQAVAQLRVAYMNTMYADADGNIGYIYNSAVPRRLPGVLVEQEAVLDGSDPSYEWQGFHSLDELPQVWNPESGWILNTNSTPFTATTGMHITRADFPRYMVGDETDNARAVSSRRVLSSLDSVSFDEFAAAVWDTRLSGADVLIPALVSEWERSSGPLREELAPVIARLRAWDRIADSTSVETTLFVLANERRIQAERDAAVAAEPHVTALAQAMRLLRERWGTIEVPWGAIARHQRPLPGNPTSLDTMRTSLASGATTGSLGSVFSYETQPFGSAAPRMGRAGNSFVKVISFGPRLRARSILNYGQSGDPTSAHFFDQAHLYVRREFKPAWFSREEVIANAVRTYHVR